MLSFEKRTLGAELEKELADARRDAYAAHSRAASDGSLRSRSFDPGIYGSAKLKEELWQQQHSQCCFCARDQEKEHNTVEHFFPKTSARRTDHDDADVGYWEYAYDPENLYFACRVCNHHKSDWFPIEGKASDRRPKPPKGTPGVLSLERLRAREKPLILDPASDDLCGHLTYVWHPRHHGHFLVPRNHSKRGEATIRIVGLNREGLFILRRRFYLFHLKPRIERLRDRRAAVVREEFGDLVKPQAAYALYTWWVLRTEFPGVKLDPPCTMKHRATRKA